MTAILAIAALVGIVASYYIGYERGWKNGFECGKR